MERNWGPGHPNYQRTGPERRMLEHVDACEGKRIGFPGSVEVEAKTVFGPRGGRRIPTRVVWRPIGTGLFRRVTRDTGEVALFPFVEWHNGNHKPRYWDLAQWRAGKA